MCEMPSPPPLSKLLLSVVVVATEEESTGAPPLALGRNEVSAIPVVDATESGAAAAAFTVTPPPPTLECVKMGDDEVSDSTPRMRWKTSLDAQIHQHMRTPTAQ